MNVDFILKYFTQYEVWFNPENLASCDYYEVSIPPEALLGKVWVDRKKGKVFIKTSYS